MSNKIYDLLIIGGGPTGLSAGIYAGRAKLSTLILEKDHPGGQVTTTSEIVNYPGIRHTTGPKLIDEMHQQALDFGVSFMTDEVQEVDFTGDIKKVYTKNNTFEARSIIIATGAFPRKLGFPGEKEFTGRGVAYCSTCDGEFFEGMDIFVVGAGYAAAEEAIFLTRFGKKVTVIAREPEFTCAKTIADRVLAHPKIEVKFNTEVLEAHGDEMLKSVKLINNVTHETFEYHASPEDGTFGLFVFIGYQPSTELFKGHVEMDPYGYILTDDNMKTNVPGVYAAGDLRPKSLRQIVTAVADGAVAAIDAERYVAEEKARHGICEDFDESPSSQATSPHQQKSVPSSVPTDETAHSNEFLSAAIKEQLKTVFAKLNKKVTLATVEDPQNPKSLELTGFISSIASLSDLITVQVYQKGENPDFEKLCHIDKFPASILLNHQDSYTGVKFHGIPGGHELNSFVLAIYNLGSQGQVLDKNILEKIASLDKPVNIKVCISLSCHFCPDVVTAAQRIAMLNSKVEAEMIDLALFPELKKEYKIMSVPALIINNESLHFGPKKIEEIVELISK